MIVASGIAMQFGAKPPFSDVSMKFGGGNRYGLIDASDQNHPPFFFFFFFFFLPPPPSPRSEFLDSPL